MRVRKNLFYVVLIAAGLLVSNITFAGDKDVNVVNTPEVNVANAPDVFVINDDSSPIPVVDTGGPAVYAREPFFYRKEGGAITTEFQVPENKILVIESINIEVIATDCATVVRGSRIFIRAFGDSSVDGPEQQKVSIPLADTSDCSPGGKSMAASLTTRIYALPNNQVIVWGPGGFSSTTFSGYLVPANSPSLAP